MLNPRIILVEDNADLRESFMDCFLQSGFDATAAGSALEFYRLIASHTYDIAILDLGLPDEDGLSLVRFLSEEKPQTGVIILTARGGASDRISGFQTGADIYLTKPVEYGELEAAIHSLSRRLGAEMEDQESAQGSDLWIFHRESLQLIAPNTVPVTLSNRECRLIGAFVTAGETHVSRADLLDALEYAQDDAGHRSLSAVLVRLRTKVMQEAGLALPIQTVRGKGYIAHNLRAG